VESGASILVVDDTPQNIRLMEAMLLPAGYAVRSAPSGEAALDQISTDPPDLVLLDLVMPGLDGHEVCRRLRQIPNGAVLPVVMVTSAGDDQKIRAIEAGADDFIARPVIPAELYARLRSLLRVKTYYDTIQRQAAELADWNRTLEERVQRQVEEIERTRRLRRFLSPQIADLVESAGTEALLESHRREIAVVFCDLRGFTAFAEVAEPEEVMSVLRAYHEAMGEIIYRFGGTLERFAGDGLMVFFNDPLPCTDPAGAAVAMAVTMRDRARDLIVGWQKLGYELDFGVGVAMGYATLGRIGFEGRFDYAAIGTVTNLASRLCDEARSGQVLVNHRVCAAIEGLADLEPLGDRPLKGFTRPVPIINVRDLTPCDRLKKLLASP
jgi:adenylate cyclase